MTWPQATDYNEAMQNFAVSFRDPKICAGQLVTNALGLPLIYTGNFAAVFKVQGQTDRDKWAVKCFTRHVSGLQERYREIGEHLDRQRLPIMVEFRYLADEVTVGQEKYPVLKMDWVEGLPLDEFLADCLTQPNYKSTLRMLCDMWLRLARRLREANVGHGDLQHGNVLLVPVPDKEAYNLRLIDYDGMYVPALADTPSSEAGHAAYQHPGRLAHGDYGPEVDRFAHLVIYTTLRGLIAGGHELWDRHYDGDRLLLGPQDIGAPEASPVFRELWQSPDAKVRLLSGHLFLACKHPLEDVPLLEELVGESKVLALSDNQLDEVTRGMSLSARHPSGELSVAESQPVEERETGALSERIGPALQRAYRPLKRVAASIRCAAVVPESLKRIAVEGYERTIGRRTGEPQAPVGTKRRVGLYSLVIALGLTGMMGLLLVIAFLLRDTSTATATNNSPALQTRSPDTSGSDNIPALCQRIREACVQREFSPSRRFWSDCFLGAGAEVGGGLRVGDTDQIRESFDEVMGKIDQLSPFLDPPVYTVQGPLAVMRLRKFRFCIDDQWDTSQSLEVAAERDGQWRSVFVMDGDWQIGPEDRFDPNNSDHLDLKQLLDKNSEAVKQGDAGAIRDLMHADARYFVSSSEGWQAIVRDDFTGDRLGGEQVEEHECTITGIKVRGPMAVTLARLDQTVNGRQETLPGRLTMYGRTESGWRILVWVDGSWGTVLKGKADLSSGHLTCSGPAAATWKTVLPDDAPPPAAAPLDVEQAAQYQQAWAAYLDIPVTIENSIGMGMVLIPPGEFLMGSPATAKVNPNEKPQHLVRITRPFYLGLTEVTQGQWESVMDARPWERRRNFKVGDDYAASDITWKGAVAFCQKLSQQEGLAYRLPTEAEWEYSSRAGTTGSRFFGPDEDLDDYGWFEENSGKSLKPVAQKKPNPWGLFDVYGNVLEWCADWYGANYYRASPANDPQGPATGNRHVDRGGCWSTRGGGSRGRSAYPPGYRFSNLGLRVAVHPSELSIAQTKPTD